MLECIKRIFVTKEHDAAMLKIEVAKFHGELAVNNRHRAGQIRRRDREARENMELVERTNEELKDFVERNAR